MGSEFQDLGSKFEDLGSKSRDLGSEFGLKLKSGVSVSAFGWKFGVKLKPGCVRFRIWAEIRSDGPWAQDLGPEPVSLTRKHGRRVDRGF